MAVALRILDDGAWISVNDERRVSVSELWRVADPGFCTCDLPDFVVEGFLEVAANGRDVTVCAYGQCIVCGESGTSAWVPVGRIREGTYHDLDRDSVIEPAGGHDAAT